MLFRLASRQHSQDCLPLCVNMSVLGTAFQAFSLQFGLLSLGLLRLMTNTGFFQAHAKYILGGFHYTELVVCHQPGAKSYVVARTTGCICKL